MSAPFLPTQTGLPLACGGAPLPSEAGRPAREQSGQILTPVSCVREPLLVPSPPPDAPQAQDRRPGQTPADSVASPSASSPLARSHADHPRLYEIDLLRFLAALSVLFFHYSFRGAVGGRLTRMSYPELCPLAHYGSLGVNLFFIISGFVILMSATGSTPKRFIISRVVRLYPAFWVCCLLTFACTLLIGGDRFVAPVKQVLVNLTMLQGFAEVPAVDGVYWSLTIELKFYFLIFGLLLLRQMRWIKAYLLVWLVVAFLLGPLNCRYGPFRHLNYFLISEFAPYFIAGAVFYLAFKEGWSPFKWAMVAASFGFCLVQVSREAAMNSATYSVLIDKRVVAGFLTAFFVIFGLIASRKLKALSTPKYLLLGALTYPLYLIHQFAGYMLFNQLQDRMNRHFLFWSVIGIMVCTAWLVNRLVERPFAKPFQAFLQRVLPGT